MAKLITFVVPDAMLEQLTVPAWRTQDEHLEHLIADALSMAGIDTRSLRIELAPIVIPTVETIDIPSVELPEGEDGSMATHEQSDLIGLLDEDENSSS